ncbi:hypothetical protein FJP64_01970 [Kosakonia cowanii]|uniref:hypothetical protein n=1 Tax=Kosakonia cowanii TaxID=208223 RepID=UPI001123AE1F|nr:hypothetical protein [Kosakonia cowanii]MDP9767973.1 hypothetical protein [Atlantibacter hermannii]TPD69275.1 hypothetical protein FJP70_02080 [Kosakonia cowanii]TPD92312.1 hypothetical protein FJP67_02080 [Kosakonia cowanii]TPE09017.1 hypothetical protein FJP64_01970 [Kosakonia cowanii]
MADYINSNILCESYIHVEPDWLKQVSDVIRKEKLSLIKSEIEDFADKRIKFFLSDDVVIEIIFTEGSIKAWITAYGPIILLIGSAILNYSSFRESVKQLASDMHRASTMLSSEMLFQTNSRNKSEILRIEARKGIIGSLERINNKIDFIDSQLDGKDLSPTSINGDLLELNDMILMLLSNLKNAEDKKLVASALSDGVSKLSIRKSRFKLENKLDESMYISLLNERKSIIKNLAQYK